MQQSIIESISSTTWNLREKKASCDGAEIRSQLEIVHILNILDFILDFIFFWSMKTRDNNPIVPELIIDLIKVY